MITDEKLMAWLDELKALWPTEKYITVAFVCSATTYDRVAPNLASMLPAGALPALSTMVAIRVGAAAADERSFDEALAKVKRIRQDFDRRADSERRNLH